MNAELVHLIALVAYGNLFLQQSSDESVPELPDILNNSFVSDLKFARYYSRDDTSGVVAATSIQEWFAFLRQSNVSRLWNVGFAWQNPDLPEHIAVAFAGGAPRAIQADLPRGFELWCPQWKASAQTQRGWAVEYRSLMFSESHVSRLPSLGEARSRLRQALAGVHSFASRPDVNETNWASIFARSLRALDELNPQSLLPPERYSLEARQLFMAASAADVFGGMGSWNDLGFSDPAIGGEYERVSAELYSAVKLASIVASNSFAME